MTYKNKTIIRVLLLIVILVIGFRVTSWCMDKCDSTFEGSSIKNPNSYLLDFSCMDKSDSHSITLYSGDSLRVNYTITDGRIDVTVGMEGQEPIYRGNDVSTGAFALEIQDSGEYKIKISSDQAKGRLELSREE